MRIFAVAVTCLIFVMSVQQPAYAQQKNSFWRDVLEFFYPSLRTPEENPYETLQAPFSDLSEDVVNPIALTPDEVIVSTRFDMPHRLLSDVADWLSNTMAEVMTFNTADFNDSLSNTEKYFDANGRALYLKFLEDNNLMKILEQNDFFIKTFVQDTPLLLNQGLVGDHYRWLFEIPILISYVDRNMVSYRNADVTTQEFTMRVQLARSPQATDFGVVIDQWEGTPGKITKPEN